MKKSGLLIGIGNALRSDDAAGLEVARRLKTILQTYDICESDGEPGKLMKLWEAYDNVIIVDAVVSGNSHLGAVHLWDTSKKALPTNHWMSSSHVLGLSEAIELARALGKLPARIAVIGIESSCFSFSESLSPAVEAGIEHVVKLLISKEQTSYA